MLQGHAREQEGAIPVKRPFVLVHGSWHGGWCWREVAAILRAAGHPVFTPTQTGLGERRHLMSGNITLETFIADIVNVIHFEALEEVVLVGHSFGASTISGVADRMPERLHHLAYLDGLILDNGETAFDGLPEDVVAARLRQAQEFDGGMSVPPPPPEAFGIPDAALGARIATLLTPHPMSVNLSPLVLRHLIGNGVPKSYILCNAPLYPALAASRDHVRAAGWPVIELASGHDAMISAPAATAAVLLSLAG